MTYPPFFIHLLSMECSSTITTSTLRDGCPIKINIFSSRTWPGKFKVNLLPILIYEAPCCPCNDSINLHSRLIFCYFYIIRNVKQPIKPHGEIEFKKQVKFHVTAINKPTVILERSADKKLQHAVPGREWKINIIRIVNEIKFVPKADSKITATGWYRSKYPRYVCFTCC